jgi:uncharacterized protein YutE (UPF0331/DUF86 family)
MKKIRKKEIIKRLREIEDSLVVLEENLPSNLEGFEKMGLVKDGIYKRIEFIIENIISISNILNSDLSLGIPSDEDSIIKNLEDKKIISGKLSEKIILMKGFRNILVHRYGNINDGQAFENIKENLNDFEIFKKEILEFINQN